MLPSTLGPGSYLGKYEVVAHIATGGMGAVYKGRDPELRRLVALKVLPAFLATEPELLERFRREARHAARLNHPHIVTLYECGHDPEYDLHYLAMEFVPGIDLGTYLERKGHLQPEETRRLLIQATKALEHAHTQNVVHRDIKPSNFLLARAGERHILKLTDLGLALGADDDEFKVTRAGNTVGTVDYISPEQARNSRAADIRSDIYSLGCTAYHMLAGHPPFAEGGLGERLCKHMEMLPPDVRQFNPEVSPEFWTILSKMLAKKPVQRYATPTDLLEDLMNTPAEVASPDSVPEAQPAGVSSSTAATPTQVDTTAALIPAEQMRAAAAFHARAVQVLLEGGGDDYARQLLDKCLKLDPFTPAYRKTLRELNRKSSSGVLSRWFGTLNVLALKTRLRAARSSGDWRKVLEHGEEVLARQADDAETHLEMAHAAEELGLWDLSLWLLREGRHDLPENTSLMRALAEHYEKRREWKRALKLWQKVQQQEPDALDASRKVNDLAAQEHMARSHPQG